MTRIEHRGVELNHCEWSVLAERARELGGVDTLIVDAPYSARTHDGHSVSIGDDGVERRDIDYSAWSPDDVHRFVETWSPLVRGWIVSQTDYQLSFAWRDALERAGRLAFIPLPCIERGGTVRLPGDGPSCPFTFAVVARPRTKEFSTWGTLPGWYSVAREKKPVVGGKPLELQRMLVRDYSRPGELVCDPCAGGGTIGLAAIDTGRRALLGEMDAGRFAIARDRIVARSLGEQRTLDI